MRYAVESSIPQVRPSESAAVAKAGAHFSLSHLYSFEIIGVESTAQTTRSGRYDTSCHSALLSQSPAPKPNIAPKYPPSLEKASIANSPQPRRTQNIVYILPTNAGFF